MPIANFYVVQNSATKKDPSKSFKYYCQLCGGDKAFYVQKGSKRKWLNLSDEVRGQAGIDILWPDISNFHFKAALKEAEEGTAFNNISVIARYEVENSASFMWIGDLETQFMEDIYNDITLPETTVVFAPHHGRKSGKLPNKWLDKLRPKIIVLGEAKSRLLHYYGGYSTITQTKAGDITFVAAGKKIHCYVSFEEYGMREWLEDEGKTDREFYVGTLNF